MTIGEIIKLHSPETYIKLKSIDKINNKAKTEIKLGDKIENLMSHDSYKRSGRRIRQVKWGG